MEESHSIEKQYHLNILPRATHCALDILAEQSWLRTSHWYLAGGTALALFAGHRQSQDLDFFTQKKRFSNHALIEHLSAGVWKTDVDHEGTIYGRLSGAKISFISYPFFLPRQPFSCYGSIKILNPKDIAVMKIIAISQRGKKRDFLDLYWYVHHLEPLIDILKRLPDQYPHVAHDYHHILKSLLYFVDAEADPMPKLFFKANWRSIKLYFQKEVVKVTKKLLRLS